MQSKSSFIPANKLIKTPFRQVSKFWGSQRIRQTPKGSTIAAKSIKSPQPSIRTFLDGFQDEGSLNQSSSPVNRRKIRSRSVPNLEALIAMAAETDGPEEGKWGNDIR